MMIYFLDFMLAYIPSPGSSDIDRCTLSISTPQSIYTIGFPAAHCPMPGPLV